MFVHVRKLNICSVNRCMSEFGSLQTIVMNKLFHQYCSALYGSHICPLWAMVIFVSGGRSFACCFGTRNTRCMCYGLGASLAGFVGRAFAVISAVLE